MIYPKKMFILVVDSTSPTVFQLKEAIRDQTGIPVFKQVLLIGGRCMENCWNLIIDKPQPYYLYKCIWHKHVINKSSCYKSTKTTDF